MQQPYSDPRASTYDDRDVKRVISKTPMPYGLKAARHVLETVTQYVHEQGLCSRRVALEEIFAPNTLEL